MANKVANEATSEVSQSNCMNFSIGRHSREVLDQMNEYRMSGMLCDIVLRAENASFPAHRVVLSAASKYFHGMFCNNMAECELKEVPLFGVRANTLRAIVDFAYTSELRVSEDTVCPLLSAGVMFQMPHIVKSCCTFLEHQLDPSNCIGIADFSYAHGCLDLYHQARDFIYYNFAEVSKNDEFLQLSKAQLLQIIRRDELNVCCEREVYEAVIRWVDYDIDRRCQKLEALLTSVRCHFLSPRFLSSQLNHCPILQRLPACADFLRHVFEELTQHRCCKERRRKLPKPAMYIIGGYLRHSLAAVECWSPLSKKWYRLASLTTPRSGIAACQVHGKIYVVGGRNNSPDAVHQDSPAVDCFDPRANCWSRCADMTVPRNRVGVAALDCLVYAVGGSDRETHHASVERYDPDKDVWTVISPMATCRIGVGLAVVNRLLYVVGGYNGESRLSTVECYHPENNEWQMVAPMSVSRSGGGVCSVDQFIYVVGGYDGSSQLSSVERYNVESDQWTTITSMNCPRSALSVSVVNNNIYAIGGYDGNNFLSSIECYNVSEDRWTEEGNMACGRSGHGVAISAEPSHEYLTELVTPPVEYG